MSYVICMYTYINACLHTYIHVLWRLCDALGSYARATKKLRGKVSNSYLLLGSFTIY